MAMTRAFMVPINTSQPIGQLGSIKLPHLGDKCLELGRFSGFADGHLVDEVVAYRQRDGFRAAGDI